MACRRFNTQDLDGIKLNKILLLTSIYTIYSYVQQGMWRLLPSLWGRWLQETDIFCCSLFIVICDSSNLFLCLLVSCCFLSTSFLCTEALACIHQCSSPGSLDMKHHGLIYRAKHNIYSSILNISIELIFLARRYLMP